MSAYKNILVAIDLGEYSEDLIEKALAVGDGPASVHLLFVNQRLESVYRGVGPVGSELADVSTLEARLRDDLKARLDEWADAFGIPRENTHFEIGKPWERIGDLANELNSDLIVIATHSRKGLKRLLGSTANAVIQHAERDVLSIHAD